MLKTHRINQGDGASLQAPLLVDGAVELVANWSAWEFVVHRGNAIADAIITLTSGAGDIVAFDDTSMEIIIPSAATIGKTPGMYNFALRATDPDGKPQTLETGRFYIDPPVRTA